MNLPLFWLDNWFNQSVNSIADIIEIKNAPIEFLRSRNPLYDSIINVLWVCLGITMIMCLSQSGRTVLMTSCRFENVSIELYVSVNIIDDSKITLIWIVLCFERTITSTNQKTAFWWRHIHQLRIKQLV
jgi:hypothetical protein